MRHGLLVLLAIVAVGCSSGSSSSGATDGGGGASGGSAGLAGASGGGAGGASGSGASGGAGGASGTAGASRFGPEDGKCFAMSTAGECISCCSDNHAAWTMSADATRQCVCTSPGDCSTQCATDYCQSQPGSPTCYGCIFPTLAPGKPCYSAAKAACGGDTDCNQYVECRAECTKLPN